MTSKKRKMPDDSAEADPDSNVGADRHHPRHHQPHRRQFRIGTSAENYFRHLYDKEPDFKQLAKQDADFAAFLQENGQLDFTNPSAVMQLTKTLLKLDFGLKVELLNDRLCPPVPNRHNYILWLKDLLDGATYSPPGAGGRPICGLDVGTGASCIYPLLGAVQRPSWHFLATDIDAESLERAKRNVEINDLSDRVRLLLRSPDDALIPSASEFPASFPLAFVMMNPPFYESADEMLSSAAKKSRPPHSACTGAPVEMVCEGGEVAHVGRLLTESLVLRERGAQFYTSMLGKVTSLEVLVDKLRENGIDNYAVTEFVQGNKTKRWAIGWSFGGMRPAEHVARGLSAAGPWRKLLPPVLRMELVSLPAGKEVGPVVERIREVVGGLELISWTWEAEGLKGVGRARENVWSRAWRRKKAREQQQQQQQQQQQGENGDQTTAEKDKDDEECRLGFAVTVEVGTAETKVTLHWREGHDPLLFESFGGFLQGKLRDLVPEK